jgi:hypothetical protein
VSKESQKPRIGTPVTGAAPLPPRAAAPTLQRPPPPAPQSAAAAVTNNNTGRVKHDDRGNAIWEWAMATGAINIDSATHRLRKLDVSSLSLADEVPVAASPKSYSPYDSDGSGKKAAPQKTDLRKLSEAIKTQRQNPPGKPGK